MSELSLPAALAQNTLDAILAKLPLDEVRGSDGGPLMTLVSQMGPDPVGHVRVFTGGPLNQLITVSMVVPAFGLDSHMLFAFTEPDSPVPHFTVDSVFAGGSYAFHLDLIPRVDLGANLAYMDGVYGPLTESFMAARNLEGLSAAALGPRQLALMSPWMLAYRANEDGFRQIDGFVNGYLARWFELVDRGLPDGAAGGAGADALATRDARNRAALFNPDVDPVWAQVTRLVGEDTSAKIRGFLREART